METKCIFMGNLKLVTLDKNSILLGNMWRLVWTRFSGGEIRLKQIFRNIRRNSA